METNRLQTAQDQNVTLAEIYNMDSGSQSIEDGRVTNFYFNRFVTLDACFSTLNLMATVLIVLSYELIHYEMSQLQQDVLLWLILVINIVTIIVCFIKKETKKAWKISKGMHSDGYDDFEVLLEIIIIILSPYPFMSQEKLFFWNNIAAAEAYYYINELLCLTSSIRVIYYVRTALLNSYYANNRTHRVCGMYACEASYMFTVKCLIRAVPFTLNYAAMVVVILVSGYALRICEAPLARIPVPEGSSTTNDFSNYLNSMWCVIVTSTTLGYGDYYPRTDIGRFVMIISCIIGNFVVSSMIVIITNESYLSNLENKVVILIDRLTLKKQMRKTAARIITLFARMHYAKKYLNLEEEDYRTMMKLARQLSIKLKLTIRKYVAAQTLGSYSEELNSGFSLMKENYKCIAKLQEELINANETTKRKLDIR